MTVPSARAWPVTAAPGVRGAVGQGARGAGPDTPGTRSEKALPGAARPAGMLVA